MTDGLTVAMIVGDENVDGLLACSLRQSAGYADEIVCVVSGTDGSAEVCEAAGARVVRRPWSGNHSIQRHVAMSYCRTEWILILDSDELMDDAFAGDWRAVLSGADAYAFPTYHFALTRKGEVGWRKDAEWHPDPHHRLLRNRLDLRFMGAVHPLLVAPPGARAVVLERPFLYHYGWARALSVCEERVRRRNREEIETGAGAGTTSLGGPDGPWRQVRAWRGRHPAAFEPAALEPRGR